MVTKKVAVMNESLEPLIVRVRGQRVMTLKDPLTLKIDVSPPYFTGQSVGGVYAAGPWSPDASTILFLPVPPTGAFYVLANAKRFGEDSKALAFDILEHAHVGVTPGVDFGSRAEGYLRFSYANSLERIEEAVERIGHYLSERRS